MEFWKKPLWRVPVVLGALGVINRLLTLAGSMIWVSIQRARGPGPDGSIVIGTGYLGEILTVAGALLFWWAGWRFVRGLTRREIFWSASIMVLVNAALLAAEQIGQAVTGSYPMWVYRLYALTEGTSWVSQLFFRLFLAAGLTSSLWVVPDIFAPYLYLVFAKKDAPLSGTSKQIEREE